MSASEQEPESTSREAVTRLLNELQSSGGPAQRAEELLPLVYDELRALARSSMAREQPGRTVQATGLVHEAYLRLVGNEDPGWNGRGHFFGAAARAMRRILIDQARARARTKRGGDRDRVEFEEGEIAAPEAAAEGTELLAVEEAVQRLERSDPRKGEIVNLRYFAGFSNEETARAMGLSVGTIEREWRFIKTWLRTSLEAEPGD